MFGSLRVRGLFLCVSGEGLWRSGQTGTETIRLVGGQWSILLANLDRKSFINLGTRGQDMDGCPAEWTLTGYCPMYKFFLLEFRGDGIRKGVEIFPLMITRAEM